MYPLQIFDASLTRVAIINDYQYLRFHFKYREVDYFEVHINRYKNNVDLLDIGTVVAIYINETYRAAVIDSKELRLTEEGKLSENYVFIGRGLDGLIAERIALYATATGTGYDVQTDEAETLMRHFVNVNCITSATAARNYADLELEADQERGAVLKYDARFQPIDDILKSLSLSSGLGWEVLLDVTNKKFKFHVYEGLDRTWENGVNAACVFSPKFSNVKLLGFRKSRLDSKNVAYVAGQGEANSREVVAVAKDGGTFTDLDRREVFIDARDADETAKLTQRGNENLEVLGKETVVELENLNTDRYRFGYEYDIGDTVTVDYPDIITINARIIEAVIELTTDRRMQSRVVVGRTYPDFVTKFNEFKSNVSGELRR